MGFILLIRHYTADNLIIVIYYVAYLMSVPDDCLQKRRYRKDIIYYTWAMNNDDYSYTKLRKYSYTDSTTEFVFLSSADVQMILFYIFVSYRYSMRI